MKNNAEFRAKYANMPMDKFMKLPIEELKEISTVRYETGYHAGSLHYLALKAQKVLYDRKFLEQRMPGEVKIIKMGKDSTENKNIAVKNLSDITLRPKISREDMLKIIKKAYTDTYFLRIYNHQYDKPQKQDYNNVISYLRKLFPSIYDFREAKKLLNLESMDRLEVCYTRIFLRNMWKKKCNDEKEHWKESILKQYGTWQEYFKACGWIEHNGSYYKPEVIKKIANPDVLKQFHVVSYHLEKRKGYRGKKSKIKENAILKEKKR